MVDKDQELLKFVKDKTLWKMLLRPDFPEEYYKQFKRDYFSVRQTKAWLQSPQLNGPNGLHVGII
jgi:hypothetical protein